MRTGSLVKSKQYNSIIQYTQCYVMADPTPVNQLIFQKQLILHGMHQYIDNKKIDASVRSRAR